MKDSEVLRLKLVSSYIASLFGQGHEDQREKIAIAQELFLNSSILDKMHPVEVFDTGFYTATSYQIQGNTIRAFEILKDVVVPVAEPEMDFRVYGEWGPVSDPNWPNRHIDARILLGLLALSLEENTVYEQMRTEIKQFTNENDQELNERFLTWIENAPTYRLDNLRTQLQ